MDIILHIGAHRTGTTDFQGYLLQYRAELAARGIGAIHPLRSHRNATQSTGPFKSKDSEMKNAARASAQLDRMDSPLFGHTIVSDANIAGTVCGNLKTGLLYPAIGARASRARKVFGGRLNTVVLCVRNLDTYWCTLVASAVAKGADVPSKDHLGRIAASRRGWRDVITDVAEALPNAEIRVLPFEAFGGRPDVLLERGAGVTPPATYTRPWVDRTPTLPALRRDLRDRGDAAAQLPFGMGHWNPFANAAHAALRELYADDMMWLKAGADGLATLIEDHRQDRAGKTLPQTVQNEGHENELEERRMARPG